MSWCHWRLSDILKTSMKARLLPIHVVREQRRLLQALSVAKVIKGSHRLESRGMCCMAAAVWRGGEQEKTFTTLCPGSI